MTPLELPASGASLQTFEPQRVDFLSPEAGGRLGAVSAGNPLWMGVWQIGKIGQAKSDAWRALIQRLRGSQRRFYGRDLARPLPLAHLGGLPSGVNGAAASWSQTVDADGEASLTLTGLPGVTLSPIDYVDFRWTNGGDARRAMVRVVIGATAASGTLTVKVEPPVPTLVVPSGAVAHIDAPACIMRLVPGEVDLGPIDRRLAITSGKITGVQDLRP